MFFQGILVFFFTEFFFFTNLTFARRVIHDKMNVIGV